MQNYLLTNHNLMEYNLLINYNLQVSYHLITNHSNKHNCLKIFPLKLFFYLFNPSKNILFQYLLILEYIFLKHNLDAKLL